MIVYFISLVINEIDCEIFSAIEELAKLAENENVLIHELEKLANQVNDDYLFRYFFTIQSTIINNGRETKNSFLGN